MKRITAIVRPEKLEPLKEALFAAKVGGMTISQVNGCGSQHGWKEYYRGTEVLLNMVPKVKFELVVADGEVDGRARATWATARFSSLRLTRSSASAPMSAESRRYRLGKRSRDSLSSPIQKAPMDFPSEPSSCLHKVSANDIYSY